MQTQYRGYMINTSSLIQILTGRNRGAAKITPNDPMLPGLDSLIRSPDESGYLTEAEAHSTAAVAAQGAVDTLLRQVAEKLDGQVFAMMSPEDLATLNFYRDQGRKFGITVYFEGEDEPTALDVTQGPKEIDAFHARANSIVHVSSQPPRTKG